MDTEEKAEYHRAYKKKRYDERRKKSIEILSKGEIPRCSYCGTTDAIWHFDHINPKTKKYVISIITNMSDEEYYKELTKCQLLCPSCHGRKSAGERVFPENPLVHGTYAGYQRCKPPCELCRTAKREYSKAWKAKKRQEYLDSPGED